MEFYTLDPFTFERQELIDQFESAIWTERFIEAGDAKLVLPANRNNLKLLAPGTLLSYRDSREIVVLDTREVQGGAMTVSGKTMEAFFHYRWVRGASVKGTPSYIVQNLFLHASLEESGDWYSEIRRLRWPLNIDHGIDPPGLAYVPDRDGRVVRKKYEAGPAYDIMLEVAQKYKFNIFIQRQRDNPDVNYPDSGWELLFVVRYPVDRSSSQPEGSDNQLVRFSPELDNFTNIKELRSDVDYINQVVVFPPTTKTLPGAPSGLPLWPETYQNHADGALTVLREEDILSPFQVRTKIIFMDDEKLTPQDLAESMNGYSGGPLWPTGYVDVIREMMEDKAEKVFAENKRTKIIEGEVVPGTQYKYKVDYKLGDLVDVDGSFSTPMKGRVTEYIRSEDATGETAFPTISANPEAKPEHG